MSKFSRYNLLELLKNKLRILPQYILSLSGSAFGCLRLARHAWDLVLISFLFDLVLVCSPGAINISPDQSETLLVASAFLIAVSLFMTSTEKLFELVSWIRKVRERTSTINNSNAPWIVAGLLAFVCLAEFLLRMQNAAEIPIAVIVVVAVIAFSVARKFAREKKAYDMELAEDRLFYFASINKQNLSLVIAPMILSRIAALISAAQINLALNNSTALFQYALTLLVFYSTQPTISQFTQRCKNCARLKVRERNDLNECEVCKTINLEFQNRGSVIRNEMVPVRIRRK